jgi:hypothetical protein
MMYFLPTVDRRNRSSQRDIRGQVLTLVRLREEHRSHRATVFAEGLMRSAAIFPKGSAASEGRRNATRRSASRQFVVDDRKTDRTRPRDIVARAVRDHE